MRTKDGDIAVFRAKDDAIFVLDNKCPHKGGPLAEGIVHDAHVTCPLHNQIIDLATGTFSSGEDGCTRTYPVDVRDGLIFIDLSETVAA